MFSAMDVTNQGQNTYSKFTNLTLEQGKTYYVWVMGEYLIVPEWIRSSNTIFFSAGLLMVIFT